MSKDASSTEKCVFFIALDSRNGYQLLPVVVACCNLWLFVAATYIAATNFSLFLESRFSLMQFFANSMKHLRGFCKCRLFCAHITLYSKPTR